MKNGQELHRIYAFLAQNLFLIKSCHTHPSLYPSLPSLERGWLVRCPTLRYHQAQPTGPGHLETAGGIRQSSTKRAERREWRDRRGQAATRTTRRRVRRRRRKHSPISHPLDPSSSHRLLPRPPTHIRNPRRFLCLPLSAPPPLSTALRRLFPPRLPLAPRQGPCYLPRLHR